MNVIIFGSAITGCYTYGMNEPRDIDVLADDQESATKMVEEWSLKKFGKIFPIDFHEVQKNEQGEILVPVLNKDNMGYEVLVSDSSVVSNVRENGFASILRLYGDNRDTFLDKLQQGEFLSLLPPEYSYYSSIQNQDKYYSGLLAFRNAAGHVSEFENLAENTNCGRLLVRLLNETPKKWKCSRDIGGDGFEWNHAYNIFVSSNRDCPVLTIGKNKMNEEQAMDFLFN